MRRIRLTLAITATMVTMVLVFSVPALAYGPRGLFGEGRVDIREGNHFIAEGLATGNAKEVKRGEEAIREGRQDERMGRRGVHGH